AIFDLPVVECQNLAQALNGMRGLGVQTVAAHPHAERRTLTQSDFRGDTCLVFGSEGYGLSAEVLAACDTAAAIPMPPQVDSLNVASAAAVFLYEANRQLGKV